MWDTKKKDSGTRNTWSRSSSGFTGDRLSDNTQVFKLAEFPEREGAYKTPKAYEPFTTTERYQFWAVHHPVTVPKKEGCLLYKSTPNELKCPPNACNGISVLHFRSKCYFVWPYKYWFFQNKLSFETENPNGPREVQIGKICHWWHFSLTDENCSNEVFFPVCNICDTVNKAWTETYFFLLQLCVTWLRNAEM